MTNDNLPTPPPTREDIDAMTGIVLLEFGAEWCGWCRRARPMIAEALAAYPQVRHIRVEDGKGRRLGRSFGVTLWPTLIVLCQGVEIARCVRPDSTIDVQQALAQAAAPR